MRRLLWMVPAVVALAVPAAVLAGGGASGFKGVVAGIEARYNVRATRIPLLGLMSLIARRSTHGGVANLHVAEFENFRGEVDGDELLTMVQDKLGPGWERMVRETHPGRREQTLVFVRQEGTRMGLFVVDLDGQDLDVVETSVDADRLKDELGRHIHGHGADGSVETADSTMDPVASK